MSLIRGKGNKSTELRLVTAFRGARVKGWRRHLLLPGKPDFTFPSARLCVFVHGCFWHGCPHCYRPPKKNRKFWAGKLAINVKRDRRVIRQLRTRGYRTAIVWECSLGSSRILREVARIRRMLDC